MLTSKDIKISPTAMRIPPPMGTSFFVTDYFNETRGVRLRSGEVPINAISDTFHRYYDAAHETIDGAIFCKVVTVKARCAISELLAYLGYDEHDASLNIHTLHTCLVEESRGSHNNLLAVSGERNIVFAKTVTSTILPVCASKSLYGWDIIVLKNSDHLVVGSRLLIRSDMIPTLPRVA